MEDITEAKNGDNFKARPRPLTLAVVLAVAYVTVLALTFVAHGVPSAFADLPPSDPGNNGGLGVGPGPGDSTPSGTADGGPSGAPSGDGDN